jgi:hypothetical protein
MTLHIGVKSMTTIQYVSWLLACAANAYIMGVAIGFIVGAI